MAPASHASVPLGRPQSTHRPGHRIARVLHAMVKHRCPYNGTLIAKLEEAYTQRQRLNFQRLAQKLGYQLVQTPDATEVAA